MPRQPHTSKQAMVLFQALLKNADAWCHGYSLMQSTDLKSGTLYPLLIRLCDDGYLEARWDNGEGANQKPRRLYRLTGTGAALAHERLSRFAEKSNNSAKSNPA